MIFMRTIKVQNYDIQRDGVSNEIYSSVDWYIDIDIIDEINPNQKVLGKEDLILDPVDDDIFILISGGIYVTSFYMGAGTINIEGFCESNPEIMKDDEQLVKGLI